METIKHIHLPETTSTNDFLRAYRGEEGSLLTCVSTDFQTAGRGQGSNRWESERGRNLTFSVLCRPQGVPPMRQFVLLEACSLALRDVLARRSEGFSVKWPNDIYWHDLKISGTLSECDIVRGFVSKCILGVGLNVNQRRFLGDAPNPVSLFHIVGGETPRDGLLTELLAELAIYINKVNEGRYPEIDEAYHASLYRLGEWHDYEDGTGRFEGRLLGVAPTGHLRIEDKEARVRQYAFKELRFILDGTDRPFSANCN